MREKVILQKIFTIVPEVKSGILKGFGIAFFYELMKFVPVIFIREIIDHLTTGATDASRLLLFFGGIVISYVILGVIDYFAKNAEWEWGLTYETLILKRVKKKLLELHLGFHEQFNTGSQVSKIVKGSQKLSELLWFTFNEFIPTLMQMFLTVILLFYVKWQIGLIFMVFAPILIIITIYASRKVQPYRKQYHRDFEDATGELGESLFNITTVKDYGQEHRQLSTFNKLLDSYFDNGIKRQIHSQRYLFGRDMIITIGRGATLGVAMWMVLKGSISTGTLVLVYTLTERAFLSTFRIGRLYNYLEDAVESIDRLVGIYEQKAAIKNGTKAQRVNRLQGQVSLENVSFSYAEGQEVLHDISLMIKPRQVIALVGRSGSGKTTLARLLLRHYDVTAGKIQIDGKDIRDLSIEEYKKNVAIVSQNVEIFNKTIRENIAFAKPSASLKEVIAAAKKAHAHEFIVGFPKGYETVVGEKGIRLSGGQKQRVSIARALLKNPEIYIFDEATSSLDSESERAIQKSIFSIAGKKTTIIIAHRLSTIRHADVIIVMDAGKVVEKGTYNELLARKGLFAKMVSMQGMAELRE